MSKDRELINQIALALLIFSKEYSSPGLRVKSPEEW